jgi:hypothetical protein
VVYKDVMALQNYTNVDKVVPGSYDDTYPTSDDGDQAMNIKAEEVSEVKVEEDPQPITFPRIKAEPEVGCMSLCVHCYAHMTNM